MGRKILAMVIGLITGLFTFVIITIVSTRYGLAPSNVEYMSRNEMAQYWSSRPGTVYVVMLLGWMLSSLAAGWITTKTSRDLNNTVLTLLVSGIMMGIGAVIFFAVTPGLPLWMIALSLLSTIPIAMLGHKIAGTRGTHRAPVNSF